MRAKLITLLLFAVLAAVFIAGVSDGHQGPQPTAYWGS